MFWLMELMSVFASRLFYCSVQHIKKHTPEGTCVLMQMLVQMMIVTHDGNYDMTSFWPWTSLSIYNVINKKCYVTSKLLQVIYTEKLFVCVWLSACVCVCVC